MITAAGNGRWRRLFAAAALALGLAATGGAAAQAPGCSATTFTDPPREVLHCRDGLTVTAEAGASYRFIPGRQAGGPPAGIELLRRGLLIELEPRRRPAAFQILTPHAIASVRGTVWAMDVGETATAVFVRGGRVAVARPGGGGAVELQAGEGLDVAVDPFGAPRGIGAPGAEQPPLAPTRWSQERAAGLLARFGR